MRIEAVTVCVNYSDFLRQRHNLPHLDRWVSSPRRKTNRPGRRCRACSLECVTTKDFERDGKFAKSRGIERGPADIEVRQLGSASGMRILAPPADFAEVLQDCAPSGRSPLRVRSIECRGLGRPGCACRPAGSGSRTNQWFVPVTGWIARWSPGLANHRHGYTPIGFFQPRHGDAITVARFARRNATP